MNAVKDPPYLAFDDHVVKNLMMGCVRARRTDVVLVAMPLYVQSKRGVRLRVEKSVTDELKETNLTDITPEDVIVIWSSCEIYFEDPQLPTILFYVKDQEFKRITSNYFNIEVTYDHVDSRCMDYYTEDGFCHTLRLPVDMMREWLNNTESHMPTIEGFVPESKEENEYKRYLFRLCAKIFLLASIPEYQPKEIVGPDRNIRRWGKAGFKHRPDRRVLQISLPSHPSRHVPTGATTGSTKAPHRRRGSLHRLVDDRYVHKKGQLIYVRPCLIHGGSLEDKMYIIRRPNDTERTH